MILLLVTFLLSEETQITLYIEIDWKIVDENLGTPDDETV